MRGSVAGLMEWKDGFEMDIWFIGDKNDVKMGKDNKGKR